MTAGVSTSADNCFQDWLRRQEDASLSTMLSSSATGFRFGAVGAEGGRTTKQAAIINMLVLPANE